MKKDITNETISSTQTEAEETNNTNNRNYLEEFELINDSFPDEDPQ